jgi:hypothetical protein
MKMIRIDEESFDNGYLNEIRVLYRGFMSEMKYFDSMCKTMIW